MNTSLYWGPFCFLCFPLTGLHGPWVVKVKQERWAPKEHIAVQTPAGGAFGYHCRPSVWAVQRKFCQGTIGQEHWQHLIHSYLLKPGDFCNSVPVNHLYVISQLLFTQIWLEVFAVMGAEWSMETGKKKKNFELSLLGFEMMSLKCCSRTCLLHPTLFLLTFRFC